MGNDVVRVDVGSRDGTTSERCGARLRRRKSRSLVKGTRDSGYARPRVDQGFARDIVEKDFDDHTMMRDSWVHKGARYIDPFGARTVRLGFRDGGPMCCA